MKIALFTEVFLPKIDGIVTRLRYSVAELQRQGDEVLIFAPGEGIGEYHGARIVRMPGVRFPLYRELTLGFPRPIIRKHLTAFAPDVIHAADAAVLGAAAIYYADVLDLPLVVSYHTRLPKYAHAYGLGRLEPFVWMLMRLRHKKAQLNLCTSAEMVRELMQHGIERVHLWPKAVASEEFHPRFRSLAMREKLSSGHPDSPLLLYVGRISAEKGIERLRPVLDALPDVRLALVGGGPYESKMHKYFAGRNANFAGYLTGQPLAEAMASADALILPSKTETLGLVLIEGMAAGTAVIGANAGGIPEIIREGETGLLFEPDDEGALTEVVKRLLSDPAKAQLLRANARRQAEQWNWAFAARELKALYRKAIETPRKPKPATKPFFDQLVKKTAIGSIKLFLP